MNKNRLLHKNISLHDLSANFAEIEPDLSPKEVMDEANRCLYCYDAPCIKACPTEINIPSFIKKIASGNMKGSARVIMDANPVGATCARVCPTEELCEGACVLNDASLPIMIGNLQRHATNWAMTNNQQLFQPGLTNGKKIAVIGGGPAGLSAARELARTGYSVTIFEAEDKAGGLDTYGIVSFRLPQDVSLWEVSQVEQLGVEIRTNSRVGTDISVKELIDGHDAVVLAIGMSDVPSLHIEGEGLNGVYDAIDFVKSTKSPPLTQDFVGKKVTVVGAGNTAIDAATCSVRLGAKKVNVLYRRTVKEMTAYPFEYDFAKQDEIEFEWLTQPVKILGDENGAVRGIECVSMEIKEPDHSGRRQAVPIEGSNEVMDTDAVILAIGQTRYTRLIEEMELDHEQGIVTIDSGTYQTSNSKIFAAGDVIFKAGKGDAMVVTAAQQGKMAAHSIHRLLSAAVKHETA
ncbi:NAD(P)-dependent oxidoreductase [Bacillus gobiensis]